MATAIDKPSATSSKTDLNSPGAGELRFVISNVAWDAYEKLITLFGDDGPRMNYSRGSLELMSPLIPHERFKKLFAYMIESLTEELDIRRNALGSTTFKKRISERGLEADECYYLANAGKLGKGQRTPDLEIDPPPDLAIEIEISSSLVDKLGIYAEIGVPEVWRFDGEDLTVLLLQADGTYAESIHSASFPFLPMAEVVRFIQEFDAEEETRWGRSFRDWVREVILPIYRRDQAAPG